MASLRTNNTDIHPNRWPTPDPLACAQTIPMLPVLPNMSCHPRSMRNEVTASSRGRRPISWDVLTLYVFPGQLISYLAGIHEFRENFYSDRAVTL